MPHHVDSDLGLHCLLWSVHYLPIIQQVLKCWYFSYFPRKQDLTFHENCLHWRQFAWNVKSCFLEKIRTSNRVFRENRCSPTLNFQLLFFLLLWPWKICQSHQNLITSLSIPNYITIKICWESNHLFARYCADKKVLSQRRCWHQCQCPRQLDLHQNQYVSLPICGGHKNISKWSLLKILPRVLCVKEVVLDLHCVCHSVCEFVSTSLIKYSWVAKH